MEKCKAQQKVSTLNKTQNITPYTDKGNEHTRRKIDRTNFGFSSMPLYSPGDLNG
jgi:hypothetical protein